MPAGRSRGIRREVTEVESSQPEVYRQRPGADRFAVPGPQAKPRGYLLPGTLLQTWETRNTQPATRAQRRLQLTSQTRNMHGQHVQRGQPQTPPPTFLHSGPVHPHPAPPHHSHHPLGPFCTAGGGGGRGEGEGRQMGRHRFLTGYSPPHTKKSTVLTDG